MTELEELNKRVSTNELIVVSYEWEGDDFTFITNQGEKYICKNAYPTSVSFSELDYSSSEELVIQIRNLPC